MPDVDRLARRAAVLGHCGARPEQIDTLLAYTAPLPPVPVGEFPLADAQHVEAWAAYREEANHNGVVPTLAAHFAQLQFPILEGVSQEPAYQAATRRGDFEAAGRAGFAGPEFTLPNEIDLTLAESAAGRVPVVTATNRFDFETLVRAFTERNEPASVPASLGACLVRGLNNWSRVHAYRDGWRAAHPAADDDAWNAEFRTFTQDKSRYQDSLVLLSRGPYSGMTADAAGVAAHDWLDRSLVIRRDHELTHYLTARVWGTIRRHFLDELLADFAGLRGAYGRYDAMLALRLLGLESGAPRPGARFELYRDEAPSGREGGHVLQALIARAARALEAVDARWPATSSSGARARLMVTLFTFTLDELAADDAVALVTEAL